jgi:hypothetical protein
MLKREQSEVTAEVNAMDLYWGVILGLMGIFYGFLVFLMLL